MYIYIIECKDKSFYTGVAKDIEARLRTHFFKTKNSAKYTKSHQMSALRAFWITDNMSNACKLEYRIKALSRQNKISLIENPECLPAFFANDIDCSKYTAASTESVNNIFLLVQTKKPE